jgi:hypothetical protein
MLALASWAALILPNLTSAAPLPKTEQRGGAAAWTLEQLAKSLTKTQHVEARFEETVYSSLLTEPLKTRGTLRFLPPSRFEKHVVEPNDELYAADGKKLFYINKAKHITRMLSLDDYPTLRAFVEPFRAMLMGDLTRLRQYYELTLEGRRDHWTMQALPRDPSVQALVRSVRFTGQGERMTTIEVLSADGDRSVMRIDEGRQ